MTDFDPGLPPDRARSDDHAFAEWAATVAGDLLLQVRESGLEGRALKDAGDLASHELLMRIIAEHRPADAILSEEEHRGTSGVHDRHTAERVWIIDPVDGTREYSEPPREDWAVHVALWEEGELAAGAVALPAAGTTLHTGSAPVVPERADGPIRIVASRTRPPAFVQALVDHLDGELVPMGSAGAKVMSVVRNLSDAYVHAGGQYEWDSAAPVAVARAAGLHTSRVDGSPLVYNQDDVLLPDLVVCRPEYAEQILAFIAQHGTD